MTFLPLDDPRWKDLDHRGWTAGGSNELDNNSPCVPNILAALIKNPSDLKTFQELWPYLCSEGTARAASYAVVPYAVELARCVTLATRFEYLFFVGLVAQCSCPEAGASFEIKPYLAEDYRTALRHAIPLLAETLCLEHDQTQTRFLLSTIAALKGHAKLAEVLGHIDSVCGECECGKTVYPDELQQLT
jgi:hypothetical protein